jgi:3-hydroxyacyl-[acyl-carrier-protein] dehydratase
VRTAAVPSPAAIDRAAGRLPYPPWDSVEHRGALVAVKRVRPDEPYFAGHFPGAPVVPGVLVIGTLTALASTQLDRGAGGPPVRRIVRFRFRRPIRPGDTVEFVVRPVEAAEDGTWFAGEARVGDTVVARGRFAL